MPEGPECKVISESVNKLVAGTTLQSIRIVAGKTKSGKASKFEKMEGIDEFKKNLPMLLKSVKCRGKFIYFEFVNIANPKKKRWYLWNNLGMTGTWKTQPSPYNKVLFKFKDHNQTEIPIYFRDQRHFGLLRFIKGSKSLKNHLSDLGPDLLNFPHKTSLEEFVTHIKKYPNAEILDLLMDQNKISGVGNYLRAEILYRSKINPYRLVKSLSDAELGLIYKYTKETMRDSYNSQGLHIKDYTGGIEDNTVDTDGLNLNNFNLMVYGRKEDPFGNKVKTDKYKNRTIHWVPKIQK